MFTHYGCITTKWFPAKSHGALDGRRPHADEPRAARAVCRQAPHPARHPRDERVDREQNGAGGTGQRPAHLQVVGSYFTWQPVTPNSNDPFSFDTGDEVQRQAGRQLAGSRHGAAAQPGRDAALHARWQQNDGPQSAISYLNRHRRQERPGRRLSGPRHADDRSSARSRACSAGRSDDRRTPTRRFAARGSPTS